MRTSAWIATFRPTVGEASGPLSRAQRECQDRLESLLKNTLNTNLQPLRSLETATKKRRAQKKATTGSGFTKSTKTNSG